MLPDSDQKTVPSILFSFAFEAYPLNTDPNVYSASTSPTKRFLKKKNVLLSSVISHLVNMPI